MMEAAAALAQAVAVAQAAAAAQVLSEASYETLERKRSAQLGMIMRLRGVTNVDEADIYDVISVKENLEEIKFKHNVQTENAIRLYFCILISLFLICIHSLQHLCNIVKL